MFVFKESKLLQFTISKSVKMLHPLRYLVRISIYDGLRVSLFSHYAVQSLNDSLDQFLRLSEYSFPRRVSIFLVWLSIEFVASQKS